MMKIRFDMVIGTRRVVIKELDERDISECKYLVETTEIADEFPKYEVDKSSNDVAVGPPGIKGQEIEENCDSLEEIRSFLHSVSFLDAEIALVLDNLRSQGMV